MASIIKYLNANASILLTFEPLLSITVPGYEPEPFNILLDPWIPGPSKIVQSKVALTAQKELSCISSLEELPHPDLVIISQHRSDHCNEQTLKQIPPTAKTIILAEPSAAKTIRGWGHFQPQNVLALKRWENLRAGSMTGQSAVARIPVPPVVRGGEAGEVTVAYIPQRRDLTRLHAAIGVTYRPPPMVKQTRPPSWQKKKKSGHTSYSGPLPLPMVPYGLMTPPAIPRSHKSYSSLPTVFAAPPQGPNAQETLPGPASPTVPLRPVHSTSTLAPTRAAPSAIGSSSSSLRYASAQRTLSVIFIFSPHGATFEGSLASYATSHLVHEAALPLTALVHCFDSVSGPWWLGGHSLLRELAGREIAVRLGALCVLSCHDGRKNAKSSARGWLRTRRKRGRCDVERPLASEVKEEGCQAEGKVEGLEGRWSRTATITSSPEILRCCSKVSGQCRNGVCKDTPVIALGSGEGVILTSEGVCSVNRRPQQAQIFQADGADVTAPP